MESIRENSCSVIQYYRGPNTNNAERNSIQTTNFINKEINQVSVPVESNCSEGFKRDSVLNHNDHKGETSVELDRTWIKEKNENLSNVNCDQSSPVKVDTKENLAIKHEPINDATDIPMEKVEIKKELFCKTNVIFKLEEAKIFNDWTKDVNIVKEESKPSETVKKRKLSEVEQDPDFVYASNASAEENEGNEDGMESDFENGEEEEETGNKPRRRGRCKKNPDIIPSHLSSDMVLGYKILLKFLEIPQFFGFHKPLRKSKESEDCKITCLNQIKKKFEENSYSKISEFVNDVREMLINIYESRNAVAIKKALRLEQILEQRIAQLPNYLRPQCALILSPDEVNNGHNKIRITKGGGFVSLLLEKTEKKRYEKFREKRRLLAEERRQLKEVQDKDVQEWEKNILMKDFEEEIKSMWELPAIGHFIHLCTDIFNIGEVAQFEVERMLLMPQCSDTLDLIMTALLTNSLVRAKLDRTPSMPYSIWAPLVKTRVMSWYRMWHKEGRNEQKLFEEIGIEPEFWLILGPDINPLDYYYFHEISLLQRVWVLKTLCDVDFVRKKTVYDNIRAQPLDELNPVNLGLDQQGNRYIQFKQFSGSDIRIYRQASKLEGDISPSELIESIEGFEYREGPITSEKVFRDIWELHEKSEIKFKKKKMLKAKQKVKNFNARVKPDITEKKNLRRSVRAKQKTYVDWSDSDQSDTDLNSLRNKLLKSETETLYRPFSDKEFISLSVFRLPRDKVTKPTKRSSYVSRRTDDNCRNEVSSVDKTVKPEPEDRKEDVKPSGCEDEQSDSLDAKNMQYIQNDFEKNFQSEEMNGDEFELGEKMDNCELDNNDVKFTVENLETLKMVFKKGSPLEEKKPDENGESLEKVKSEENTRDQEYDSLYKYNVPNYLKPDSSKFYLVVDSVEGLRQLISKFGSHENDLEIITRSTKSKKKSTGSSPKKTSCEVQLIENLQNLLIELEPWEFDLMKSYRSNKEKMYKEYMNFINRPPDFVHPNEAYWMKTYEEPAATTATSTATTTTTTTTTADSTANGEKNGKELGPNASESTEINQQGNPFEVLPPRKRTRVTRVQLQPESDEYEDFDDGDDYESNESDDNWVLPTPKKRTKKETPSRGLKILKKLSGKKAKSSPVEKVDSPSSTGEKLHTSSPERAKKALFWGPRSSDPSEDLNWEKNRQKILEQHNSPVKKPFFNTNEIIEPKTEPEAQQHSRLCDNPPPTVISPKRFTSQIPGNKKVYLTAAQLKALENDSKQESKQEVITKVSEVSLVENKTPIKVQTYSRVKKDTKPRTVSSSTVIAESKPESTPSTSEAHIKPKTSSGTSIIQSVGQPVTRVQQIQIQDTAGLSSQNKVVSNVKVQPTGQWQQKVIVNQPGKVIQQPVQNQAQAQTQIQIQNPPQNQVQQIVCLEPQKLATMQQPILLPPEKLGNFLHMVNRQAQRGTLNAENELYLTDGKNLIKFDSSFVQQLQKDKMVVDLKKTLLLVKPKFETKTTAQEQPPTVTQQNILVVNKPTAVQQPANSVPNFLIPANYVIKDANQQMQPEQGYQSVKIIQPAPAYVIQQKSATKPPSTQTQPTIIKLISPQPLASNQNLILSPVAGQVIQPVNQTVMKPDQQAKTLRFIRPHIETSIPNKVNSAQNPIIVNNIVELQGQKLAKSQAPVVAGRVISTAVPTVRMSAPQTVLQPTQATQVRLATSVQNPRQTVVASTVLNPQVVKSNVITQPVRLTAIAQPQVQISASGANTTPQFVYSTPVKITNTQQSPGTQTVRLASSPNLNQVVRPGTAQVKLPTSQSPAVMPTTFVTQQIRPAVNTQTIRLVSQPASSSGSRPVTAQVKIVQSSECQPQTVSSVSTPPTARLANSQSVRFVQPQPVRLVPANNVGLRFVNKNVTPIKTGVITSVSRSSIATVPSVRPPATVAQPPRLQAVLLQSPTVRPPQEKTEASPVKKAVSANPVSNPSVLLVGVDNTGNVGDKAAGEYSQEGPVTLDYIHGELSVKKTSQGWKYAVKASNGKDIILTDEQIEERLKANNGVMK